MFPSSFNRFIPCLVAALIALSGCTESDPVARARALQASGELQESVDFLRNEIDQGAGNAEIYFLYGRGLTALGRPSQAVWPLEAAAEDPEWFVPAALQLADNGLTTHNWNVAIEAATRVLDEDPDNIAALVVRMRAYISTRRNYDDALDDVNHIAELEPDNIAVMAPRAIALLGLHRPEEALEVIEEAQAHFTDEELNLAGGSNGGDAFWCAIRGTYARDSGDIEGSIKIFDECVEAHPASPLVVDKAVEMHEKLLHGKRAQEILANAIEEQPENRTFRVALVRRLELQQDLEGAERLLQEATELDDPDLANHAWADLGGFLISHGRTEEGLEAYEKFLESERDPAPELLLAYAEQLITSKRFDRALEVAERTPVAVHGDMLRGRVALEQGDYVEALEYFDAVMTVWPDNAPIRYYAALTCERLGLFDRAIEEYRQAIRSDSDLVPPRERLARLHMAEGVNNHAYSILRFASPRKTTTESISSALLDLELRARLGKEVDLAKLPTDSSRRPLDLMTDGLLAILDGAQSRGGPAGVLAVLKSAEESGLPAARTPKVLIRRTQALIATGREGDAVATALKAKTIAPEDPAVLTSLGIAQLANEGLQEKGIASLEMALSFDGEYVEALVALASAVRAETPDRAIDLYARAVAADPEDGRAIRGLANTLTDQGRGTEAREQLENYLIFENPYDGGAALALARIAEQEGRDATVQKDLAQRALRFGGGDPAAAFLNDLEKASAS